MPLYEYYCERCDEVFEALRPLRESDQPLPCPTCDHDADRIMPSPFAPMSFKQGYAQRVPFHHRPIRSLEGRERTIAPVKPKSGKKRSQSLGGRKKG